MNMRYQINDHGRAYYEAQLLDNEPNFDQVYAAVWKCLYQPSPPFQAPIDQSVSELGLQGGDYDALHVRSVYSEDKSHKASRVENAVNCVALLGTNAWELMPRRKVTIQVVVYNRIRFLSSTWLLTNR